MLNSNIVLALSYRDSVWEWKVSQWIIFLFGNKECFCTVQSPLPTTVYLISQRYSVTVLLKTYVPSNVTFKSYYK